MFVTFLLVLAGACDSDSATESTDPSTTATRGLTADALVVNVVDGDTLEVELADGTPQRLRIVGVNAPESGECFSAEAAAELERLVGGRQVTLIQDRSDRDRYGRLLRYVEYEGEDVGAELVRNGFALVRVSSPDDGRERVLRSLEARARDEHRGLWSDTACGAAPAGSEALSIVGLRLDATGDDAANLNDEWVELSNVSPSTVELTGWIIRDESSSHRYSFPSGYRLDPGATVRVHSGCGEDSRRQLFWCVTGSAIWNNDGDTALLLDPSGNIVDRREE